MGGSSESTPEHSPEYSEFPNGRSHPGSLAATVYHLVVSIGRELESVLRHDIGTPLRDLTEIQIEH